MVNTGTVKNEDDDQQCTDDIDELSPQMEEQPIRSSAAKHFTLEQRDSQPCPITGNCI